jgi:dienelactone hydrolase
VGPVRRVRSSAAGLVVVVAAAVLAGCGGSGSRTATPSVPAAAPGGYDVGRLEQTFVDTRRPTPANGDAPALPSRTLETVLLYPLAAGSAGAAGQPAPAAARGPFPLVVFGHGFTGSPAAYDNLLRAWVAAGYVVAAPSFPLSNGKAPGGPTQNDIVNQPGDVSFVITQVLSLARADGPLRGAVDPDHVGVAGHSMGAATVLGVVLHTCCHDDRVTAAVVLSGNEVPMPNGQFSGHDPTPVLFVHGDADDVVPYSAGRRAFADAVAPKFFVTLPGADHGGAFSGGTSPASGVVVRSTIDFLDRYLKGRDDGLARLRRDASLAGVASLEAIEK